MKKIFIIYTSCLFLTGCSEWLGDNKNPNMQDEAPINALMTSVIEQTSENQFKVSLTTSLYAQYLASPNSSDIDKYGRVTLDDCWATLYKCMANANDLYFAALRQKSDFHAGAALVLLSYNALTTTDLWGDIPFTEAFKGQLFLHPEYDNQEFIYDTIISNINLAIKLLNNTRNKIKPDGDILYRKTVSFENKRLLWKKFAFAVKARALIHLSKKSKFLPSLVLSAIDSSFTSNEEQAALYYLGNKINPWYTLVNNSINGGLLNGFLSSQLIESLNGSIMPGMPLDPRIAAITDTTKGGVYRGTKNGAPPPSDGFCTLNFRSWQAQKTAPIVFISYSELKFIEAEASLIINDNSRAYNAYLKAIEANFSLLGITENKFTSYISSSTVIKSPSTIKFSDINYQKWLVLFLQPEGWTEVRRKDYNYPAMTYPESNLTNNTFIRRILYPDTERSYNSRNVPNIDNITEKLWFDK